MKGFSDYDLVRTWEQDGYKLEIYDTGLHNRDGKMKVAYRFYDDGKLIFEDNDFYTPYAVDGDKSLSGLLGFISLQPGDTDADYFLSYTPFQMEWANSYRCEMLSGIVSDMEGN